MTGRAIAALFCFSSLWFGSTHARAQTGYAGVWQAGPSRIAVTLHSWGDDCGPRPQSTTQPGGGTVEITEFGRNLAIHATDRTILTNACWSQNRAITRVSSSFLDGVWTTKCRTPPSDPKSEEGEYVLKVENGGTLQYRDSSNYNWELRTSNCVASIVTTQTLTRSTGMPAAAPATTKAAAKAKAPVVEESEAPEPQNCTPGVAIRLVVRPKRVQIEPGQRTCLRAVALDAAGCPVPGTDVRWTLQHSPALRGSLNGGCFQAASSAAEAEGEFKLVAVATRAEGLRAEGVVEVSTVDFSDLMARRIETGAISGRATSPTGTAQSQTAARVQARSESTAANRAPLIVIGAGALLAIGGLVWWSRRRSIAAAAAPVETASFPPPRATPPQASAAASAPVPKFAAPPATAAPTPAALQPAETWICPACRRGQPKEQVSCNCKPGGTRLVPYQEFAQQSREVPVQDRKSCPGCGNACPSAAAFCGACGKRF